MRLRRKRSEQEADVQTIEHLHAEARVEDAQRTLNDLKTRADRVVQSLNARHERNHWGETVARIARREV